MTTTTTTTTKKKPVETIRIGFVHAAIWRNTDRDGRPRYSTTIGRRYPGGNGTWKSTNSFDDADLVLLSKVADLAATRVRLLQAISRGDAIDDDADVPTTLSSPSDSGAAAAAPLEHAA